MSERPSIEKEINDTKKTISAIEKDVRQLRDWISSNERTLPGMQETLRRITEEGLTRARTDLAQRETQLQQLREVLAQHEKVFALLHEIERKEQDIARLEREQEKIIVLLERHQAELRQLRLTYAEMTQPVILPACELVLPDNNRIPLDAHIGTYTIGWSDMTGGGVPDIDLHRVGGSTLGVSRKHALLRWAQQQWTITDLGSTNGTYVNDTAIVPHTPTALPDKTRLRLGNLMLFFRYITATTRL